jgi:biopolymer transport protein ExbD
VGIAPQEIVMRITGAQKVHYDSGPNMTPLVDVVMVILIFLMLCGSFGGMEHFLATSLPAIGPGQGPASPFGVTQVDIRVDHDPVNANAWKARFGDAVTGSPERLKTALAVKFNTFKANGTTGDQLQVVIHPDRFVKWNTLIAIYQAAMEAGYTKISFSTGH